MSRYDGLIIPRSYSEYLNKTDSATLSQMLQHLTGLWSHAVSAGDNKPVTSDAVNNALENLKLFSYHSRRIDANFNELQTNNEASYYAQLVDSKSQGTFPVGINTGIVVTFAWDGNYATQLFLEVDTERRMYIRYIDDGNPNEWKQFSFIS